MAQLSILLDQLVQIFVWFANQSDIAQTSGQDLSDLEQRIFGPQRKPRKKMGKKDKKKKKGKGAEKVRSQLISKENLRHC